MAKFRVKELAQERNITQEELARKSGQSVSTIIRLWRNKSASEPRASTMIAIAAALGVSIHDLYAVDAEDSNMEDAPTSLPVGNKMSLIYQRSHS